MVDRPKTIREIQAEKETKRKLEQDKVTIYNISDKQTITIQILGKQDKTAIFQSSMQIGPRKSVSVPRDRLMMDQIDGLRARGLITITGKLA